MVRMRGLLSAVGMVVVALALAACQSAGSNTANLNMIGAPRQLPPVQDSNVQQASLPALGAPGTAAPGLSGQPVLGGVQTQPSSGISADLARVPNTGGSFVSLEPPNQPPAIGGGAEGVWNVVVGETVCRLNLPLTAKTGTSYYRASAPGCSVPQLASVSGWQQVGSQLQLYDESGNIAAFLAPNGGRYIGTVSGGQAVSMSR